MKSVHHWWKQDVNEMHELACDVLRENNLPITADKIEGSECIDWLISHARQIVLQTEKLYIEIDKGRIDYALDCLTIIHTSYQKLWILKNVPELENGEVIADKIIKAMGSGFKSIISGAKNKEKGVSPGETKKIIEEAIKVRTESPKFNKTAIATKIKKDLNLDWSIRTIKEKFEKIIE